MKQMRGNWPGVWAGKGNDGRTIRIEELAVTLRVTGEMTEQAFAVVEFTAPPAHPGLGIHLHQHTIELIYVVAGTLAVTLGEATSLVRPGNSILVRPRNAHRLWNPSSTAVTYLTLLSPSGEERYYEQLAHLLANRRELTLAEATALAALDGNFDHILVHS